MLLALTGCLPLDDNGHNPEEYHKWFNPDGKKVEDLKSDAVCASKDVPALSGVDPHGPEGVPPGAKYSVITVRLEAFKVRNDGKVHAWCIPAETHIYLDLPGASEPTTFREVGSTNTISVPWDGITRTPWIAEATIIWSPEVEKKIGGFPSFTIDVSSRYVPEIDDNTDLDVITYKCAVYFNLMQSPVVYDASLDVTKKDVIRCNSTLQAIPFN